MSKGGKASNSSQVWMQQQEAAEARAKEEARKARLEEGMSAINKLFEGSPIMGTRKAKLDLSKFNPDAQSTTGAWGPTGYTATPADTGLKSGFKYAARDMTAAEKKAFLKTAGKNIDPNTGLPKAAPGAAAAAPMVQSGIGTGQNTEGFIEGQQSIGPGGTIVSNATGQTATPTGGKTAKGFQKYEITDANGNVIGSADSLEDLKAGKWEYDEKYDTGKKTDPFQKMLADYEQKQKDYYYPELQKQFGKANETLDYSHVNAGTLLSSMAAQNAADLVGQNKLQKGAIDSNIQDSLGQVKRSIASDKTALINQLYATENPTMASNEALAKVRTINQSAPALSPIGELFKTAAVGAGSFLQSANDPYNNVNYGGYAKGNSRTIT